jgi:hypothetical protein
MTDFIDSDTTHNESVITVVNACPHEKLKISETHCATFLDFFDGDVRPVSQGARLPEERNFESLIFGRNNTFSTKTRLPRLTFTRYCATLATQCSFSSDGRAQPTLNKSKDSHWMIH